MLSKFKFLLASLLVCSCLQAFSFSRPVSAASCLEVIGTGVDKTDECNSLDDGDKASCSGANMTYFADSDDCGETKQSDVNNQTNTNTASSNTSTTTSNTTNSAAALSGSCYFPIANGSLKEIRYTFGQARSDNTRCHAGIDIMTTGDEQVVAAANGTVLRVMDDFVTCKKTGKVASAIFVSYGSQVLVYGEIDPGSFNVAVGDSLSAGQYIGTTHNCGMLHLEVRADSNYYRWMPPDGQLVGSSANYCREHYLSTAPSNLVDPTSIVEGFNSGQCLTANPIVAGGTSDSGSLAPSEPYLSTYNVEIKKHSADELASQLIWDGNQAYCSAASTIMTGFTRSTYKGLELDLSQATIPLMRNQNAKPERLNSAETYYGYTANESDNSAEEILTQSSAMSKYLDEMSSCVLKVTNQIFLFRKKVWCSGVVPFQELCAGNKTCVRQAQESCVTIQKMGLTDEEITLIEDDLAAKYITVYGPESKHVDPGSIIPVGEGQIYLWADEILPYCANLIKSQDPADQKLRQIYQKMPLHSNNLYRTAHIVQAIKICPVNKTNGGPDGEKCGTPTYKYNNCSWQIVPDYVRVYPFRIPDFATNHNVCHIYYADPYPNFCQPHNLLNIAGQDGTDIANLNAQMLQLTDKQEQDVENVWSYRNTMVGKVKEIEYNSPENLVYCANCKTKMAKALVKIINATNEYNVANEEYLGSEAGNMSCKVAINGEKSKEIKTSAFHSSPKDGPATYEPPALGTVPAFPSRCCLSYEWVYEKTATGVRKYQICSNYAYSKAQVHYWIVAPQGVQLKTIEDTILGTFYQDKDNDLKVTTPPSSGAGGGTSDGNLPVTDIDYSTRSLTEENQNGMRYWLYKPQSNVTGLPVIVFLHGAGLAGPNNPGLTQLIDDGADFPAVIIAPITSSSWKSQSSLSKVKSIIDSVVAENNLNSNKISITGHSMGGRGVYHIVTAYPGFFSAAAPISAINAKSDPMNIDYSALAQLPLRSYVGRSESYAEQPRVNRINEAGGDATLISVDGAGHLETPAEVYPLEKTDLIQWLISQSSSANNSGTGDVAVNDGGGTGGDASSTETSPSDTTNTKSGSNMGSYTSFVAADRRQNKYLSLQGVTTKGGSAPALNILGAGPITNIFIVQESLYPQKSGLHETLLKYRDINEYFVQNSGLSSTSNDICTPANPEFSSTGGKRDTCSYTSAQVRIKQCPDNEKYPCSVFNPVNGTADASDQDAPASAYPGGVGYGDLCNCTAVSKDTISFEDYLLGVISQEDSRLLSDNVSIEALKLSIAIYKTYTIRRSAKNGAELIANSDGRCFQVYRPATSVSAAKKSRFQQAYQSVGNNLVFNKSTNELIGAGYNNRLQNCIIDLAKANPSTSYEKLLGMLGSCDYTSASLYANEGVIKNCN